MRLEEGIRKMTSFPASIMRIKNRGLLKEGFFADITTFNPDTIIDCATYQNPHSFPIGIDYVIVNGEIAVEGDKFKKESCGKVLKQDI
jgi:N-acyl-D-amino-acid deacylase